MYGCLLRPHECGLCTHHINFSCTWILLGYNTGAPHFFKKNPPAEMSGYGPALHQLPFYSVDFNPFNWAFSRCCAKLISTSESSWPIMIASLLCLFLGGDCSTSRLPSVRSNIGSFSTRLMDATEAVYSNTG